MHAVAELASCSCAPGVKRPVCRNTPRRAYAQEKLIQLGPLENEAIAPSYVHHQRRGLVKEAEP